MTTTTPDRLDEIEALRTRFRAWREDVIQLLLAHGFDYTESSALCLLQEDTAFFADELDRGFRQTGHCVWEYDDTYSRERHERVTDSILGAILLRDFSAVRKPPVFTQAEELGLQTA